MIGRAQCVSIAESLALSKAPGLISIVGGGGKSSLLFALARELPGRVVMTTTTRIFTAQLDLADAVHTADEPDLLDHVDRFETNLIVVGHVEGERAVGVAPGLPAALLARPRVDWVVVEADGSRMLPAKAPADHEPVIPPETSLLVTVAGIDALNAPIATITHRPERVSDITGLAPEEPLTPKALAQLLTSSRGGLKHVPDRARVALLINKVATDREYAAARRVAERALENPRVDRVVVGALQGREPTVWEIWRRELA